MDRSAVGAWGVGGGSHSCDGRRASTGSGAHAHSGDAARLWRGDGGVGGLAVRAALGREEAAQSQLARTQPMGAPHGHGSRAERRPPPCGAARAPRHGTHFMSEDRLCACGRSAGCGHAAAPWQLDGGCHVAPPREAPTLKGAACCLNTIDQRSAGRLGENRTRFGAIAMYICQPQFAVGLEPMP